MPDRFKSLYWTAGFCIALFTQTALAWSGLLLKCQPSGAEVYIDDEFVGRCPSTFKLKSGTHVLRLRAPIDFKSEYFYEEEFSYSEGEDKRLKVVLKVRDTEDGARLRMMSDEFKRKEITELVRIQLRPGAKTGASFRECSDCPDMVIIPSGSFTMGSPGSEPDRDFDEGPLLRMSVENPFALSRTEITQSQWRLMMGEDPPGLGFKYCDECPVERVSWHDAQRYLSRLSAVTGQSYRLPSEVEWEYACRAGQKHRYCGGDRIDDLAWYIENSGGMTHPVSGKLPNGFGLQDMTGNVAEWLQDCGASEYGVLPVTGAAYEVEGCKTRGIRGGSWSQTARFSRAANRFAVSPGIRYSHVGFRAARTLP
jgi:formylglycine-generating enzyme required for sulfatase activity